MNLPHLPKKTIVPVAVFSVLALAIIVGVIWPSVSAIRAISRSIEEEHANLERQYEQGKRRKKIREDLNALEARLPLLEKATLKKEELLSLIEQLETRSKALNLSETMTLDLDTKDPSSGKTVFTMSLEGPYDALLHFLHDVETLPWYFNVETIEMTKGAPRALPTRTPRAPETQTKTPSPFVRALIQGHTFIDEPSP